VQHHPVSPDGFIDEYKEWAALIGHENVKSLLKHPCEFYHNEIIDKTVFPQPNLVFKAFELPPSSIKCCIIGQDPYHTAGMATGLAFSVPKKSKIPPSLKNMAKEAIKANPSSSMVIHGDLSYLAKQGVFLLNTSLSVNEGVADSHKKAKWQAFTHEVIRLLSNREKPLVFLAWGTKAHKLVESVSEQHIVKKTSHPSPLGARKSVNDFDAFINSDCFNQVNVSLSELGEENIVW